MTKESMMLREAAVVAAGLAMTVGLGVAGVGTAAATSPAPKVKTGSQWTIEAKKGGCEIETFGDDGTFTGDLTGDAGTYSGGGAGIIEDWTEGVDSGFTFSGLWVKVHKEYKGDLENPNTDEFFHAIMLRGVVSGC
jgi:hypothetical protein